jgi:hypothetical protein
LQIDLTSHLQIREFNLIIISCHWTPGQSLKLLLLCPQLS